MKLTLNKALRRVNTFKNPPEMEANLVLDFFSGTPGFFVDVGANHPILDSQSWHLEVRGWKGLLIEPMPDCVKALRQHRTNPVAAFACSSPGNHQKIQSLKLAGAHSTLEDTPIALGARSGGCVGVECRTLDSILQDYAAPTGFEFLSIDVEGHEEELFKGFNILYWQPRLILLEDHVTHHRKHNWMKRHGYKLLLRTGLNSWYVPESEGWRLGFAAKVGMFRKYWLGLLPRKAKFS